MLPDMRQPNLHSITYEIFLLKKLKRNRTEPLVLTSSLQKPQWMGGQVKLNYKEVIIQTQNVRYSAGQLT